MGPWCSLELPAAGIFVGNLIRAFEGPPRPEEAKVFALRFTDDLHLTSWTIPRYHEVIWKNEALHGAGVLAYTPAVVIASLGDGELAWLDAATGKLRRRWQAHHFDCGLLAAVHPKGDRVATTGCDEAVRVWDLSR